MDNQSCDRCRYWRMHRNEEAGDCRINPPQIIAAHLSERGSIEESDTACIGYWPNTGPTDWCGRFKAEDDHA
jgi:hypothetical protein